MPHQHEHMAKRHNQLFYMGLTVNPGELYKFSVIFVPGPPC